jgi:acyl dehydratase
MKIGDKASLTKKFSKEETEMFSTFSLDSNPIHFNELYAAGTKFKRCIVQGPMVASLIGGVLGSKLPGNGSIYVSQNTKFLKPVFVGDTVTANVEIKDIREDKPVITLRTWVVNEAGDCVIDGEAVILFINTKSDK